MTEIAIESRPWLSATFAVVFAGLGAALFHSAVRAFGLGRSMKSIRKRTDTVGRRAILIGLPLAITWRMLFSLSSLAVAWLFYLNAFVWFHRVEATDGGITLDYSWPKPQRYIPSDVIVSVEKSRTRNGRQYVKVATKHGNILRSVSTRDSAITDAVLDLVREGTVRTLRNETVDTPVIRGVVH